MILTTKARSGMGSQGNLQLVAQGEVFEDQFGVASKDRADQAKDQLEEFDHRGRLAASSCEPLPSPNHRPTGGYGYSDLLLPPTETKSLSHDMTLQNWTPVPGSAG
jgi:hypothetical protein